MGIAPLRTDTWEIVPNVEEDHSSDPVTCHVQICIGLCWDIELPRQAVSFQVQQPQVATRGRLPLDI